MSFLGEVNVDKLPEPSRYQLGAAGPSRPVILVTSSAASSGGLTCNAAFVGLTCGGCRWVATRWGVFSKGMFRALK